MLLYLPSKMPKSSIILGADSHKEFMNDKRFVGVRKIITVGEIPASIDMPLTVNDKMPGEGNLVFALEEMEWQWHQGR